MLVKDDDDRELEIDVDSEDEPEIEQEEEDEAAETEDRGDDAEPELNELNLRKVATEDEAEEEEEQDEAGGPSMIPKGRLNKALNARDREREGRIRAEERARMLEEQIRGQNSGKKQEDETPAVELNALRKQRMEAMMEGDIEKATVLEEQIEAEIRRAAREDAVAAVTAATARQQFAEAVQDVIETFPFLDSKSKGANADAIEQVVALRDQYINKGASPATALRKAAEKVGPLYEPRRKKSDEEDDERAEVEERTSKKVLSVREQLALKRNADAARRQPASLKGGVGERATAAKINVADMDEDEYAKLPERVRRQLRGDEV
jgi:hypothetical protein